MLKADVIGDVGDSLWIVLAMIGVVLVIASANVTNLLLVRGESKARELEVRAALGAGSWRIARSMLAESLLLAAVAGVLGIALAYMALEALLGLAPQQVPRLAELAIDARSLTFALLVTLAAGATISLAPVLRAARARLSTGLRAARGTSAGRAQHRAQNALVVGQVALGARARDVQRRIVGQGVLLAGIGIVVGLVAAAAMTRLMTSLLYDVQPIDPLTYAAVAVGLIAVAALASYVPARRASAVDPAESLAAE